MIMVTVPFEIVPCPRPRVSSVNGFTKTYYPKKYEQFKAVLGLYLKSKIKTKLEGAIKVEAHITMQMPKSWSKKKRMEMDGKYHTQKPDKDNLEKSLYDALTGVAFKDDSAVAVGVTTKRWGEHGKAIIAISELDG